MVHSGICHHSGNVDKWFLKHVLPFYFYVYFWNCMKPHWYLNWKSCKDFHLSFSPCGIIFPYVLIYFLPAFVQRSHYESTQSQFCWDTHLERILLKFTCSLYEEDGEEETLIYVILKKSLELCTKVSWIL